MTWTGSCPQCGHGRADHVGSTPAATAQLDATEVLRCSRCSCAVTGDGHVWPTDATDRSTSE